MNPNGGAIALGHPLGVSGARMVATILRELKRRNGRYGVVTMCIGGGMGAAALVRGRLTSPAVGAHGGSSPSSAGLSKKGEQHERQE